MSKTRPEADASPRVTAHYYGAEVHVAAIIPLSESGTAAEIGEALREAIERLTPDGDSSGLWIRVKSAREQPDDISF